MTSTSFNLSGKLESSLVEVLGVVNQVAITLGIHFFVVGAMARDIVLEYCHAIPPPRGTRDLDIGVEVPTIPGMGLLKVISWNDRYPERPKDAEDLLFLMDHYAGAGNEERLYEQEDQLLQEEGFDLVRAGIRLLGRDMAVIASDSTGETVASILKNEMGNERRYKLVQDMIRGTRIFDEFDETLEKLKKLAQGFAEGLQKDKIPDTK